MASTGVVAGVEGWHRVTLKDERVADSSHRKFKDETSSDGVRVSAMRVRLSADMMEEVDRGTSRDTDWKFGAR